MNIDITDEWTDDWAELSTGDRVRYDSMRHNQPNPDDDGYIYGVMSQPYRRDTGHDVAFVNPYDRFVNQPDWRGMTGLLSVEPASIEVHVDDA